MTRSFRLVARRVDGEVARGEARLYLGYISATSRRVDGEVHRGEVYARVALAQVLLVQGPPSGSRLAADSIADSIADSSPIRRAD